MTHCPSKSEEWGMGRGCPLVQPIRESGIVLSGQERRPLSTNGAKCAMDTFYYNL